MKDNRKPKGVEPEIAHTVVRKTRKCIKCRVVEFISEHFGDRYCPVCRGGVEVTGQERIGGYERKKWGET